MANIIILDINFIGLQSKCTTWFKRGKPRTLTTFAFKVKIVVLRLIRKSLFLVISYSFYFGYMYIIKNVVHVKLGQDTGCAVVESRVCAFQLFTYGCS